MSVNRKGEVAQGSRKGKAQRAQPALDRRERSSLVRCDLPHQELPGDLDGDSKRLRRTFQVEALLFQKERANGGVVFVPAGHFEGHRSCRPSGFHFRLQLPFLYDPRDRFFPGQALVDPVLDPALERVREVTHDLLLGEEVFA